MPKKCESCKFYQPCVPVNVCTNEHIKQSADKDFVTLNYFVEINPAREICNREGDGIFVYFEPTVPIAGAAAEIPHSAIRTPQSLVQITRNRPRSRHAAAGGVL